MRPSVLTCLVTRIVICSAAAIVFKRCRVAQMRGRAGEVSLVSRSHKRRAMVKRIETTAEFQIVTEEAQPSRPDPDDPDISKRRWEQLMLAWRRQLRASEIREAGADAVASPLYLNRHASRIRTYSLKGDV